MALFDNTDFSEKHGLPLIVLVFWIILINGVLLFPLEKKSKGDSGNSNSSSIPMVHGLPIMGVVKFWISICVCHEEQEEIRKYVLLQHIP